MIESTLTPAGLKPKWERTNCRRADILDMIENRQSCWVCEIVDVSLERWAGAGGFAAPHSVSKMKRTAARTEPAVAGRQTNDCGDIVWLVTYIVQLYCIVN